jgi:hypothetical protein
MAQPQTAAFTITINTTADGPFSLYSILSTGLAPTGCTLGVGASITPVTGKPIALVNVQVATGGNLYLGDASVTPTTNGGLVVYTGASQTLQPVPGVAWANSIYFNADAATTVVNFWVFYGA